MMSWPYLINYSSAQSATTTASTIAVEPSVTQLSYKAIPSKQSLQFLNQPNDAPLSSHKSDIFPPFAPL